MNYQRMAATAVRLIAKNGAPTLFHRLSSVASDSLQPWKGSTDTPVVTVEQSAVFVHPVSEGMKLGITGNVEDLSKRFSGFVLTAPNGTQDISRCNLVQRSLSEGKQAIEFVEVLKPGSIAMLYIFGIKR